jgi:cobalt-zinc-cadmium efflux system outer membrane protein
MMCALVSVRAQSVSDQFKQRTGNALPDAPSDPAKFTLPPGIDLDKALAPRDAVAIALWNNAALHADLARLDVSRADLIEAGQFRNPNLSMLLPVGPKPFELLVTWPIEELLNRKRRVKAAEIDVQAVTSGLVQNGLDLSRDTLVAHADLWAAERRVKALADSAQLAGRVTDLTRRRRDLGEGTGFEVSLATSDSQSASEAVDSALGDVATTAARLRWLMGIRGDPRPLSAALGAVDTISIPQAGSLMETALSSRPDLRAAELAVNARAESAKWERSRVIAMIAPALSVKEVGDAGTRAGPGFNIELPLLSRNGGRISRAEAEAVRAVREYVAVKDRVAMEVVAARERAVQAQNALKRIRDDVRSPVEESIRIAERAYRSGDVPLLNVLESSRRLTAVDLSEIDARAALARALADLERAIGRSL